MIELNLVGSIMRFWVGNQSVLTKAISEFFLACIYLFIHYNTKMNRWPQDFFMGPFCAGTNTVSRQNDALHPSRPLYIKSVWLKPARLRLDWLRILTDHPYWLESYQSENKKSDPAAEVS